MLRQNDSVLLQFLIPYLKGYVNSKSILLACHYHLPDGSKYLVDNFNTLIHDNINKISNDDRETVIMGDFNINYQFNSDN